MNAVSRMVIEMAKDSLRSRYRRVVDTIMASGVDEDDAHLAAIAALDELRWETQKAWMDAHTVDE